MPESRVPEDATASHAGVPPPMVVVTMGDKAPADGMQVLASIGRPPRQLVVLSDIEKALAAYPDETLVVVLTSPARSLLSALQRAPCRPLPWRAGRNRPQPRSALFARRAAVSSPSTVMPFQPIHNAARKFSPHACKSLLTVPWWSQARRRAVTDSPSLALVAALLFECDPDARGLADEIEATLSVASTVCEIGVEQIDQLGATFQARTGELDALKAERDLLRDDLVQMQEQLERAEMERSLRLAASEATDRRMATLTGKHQLRESTLGAAVLQCGALAEARGAEIETLKAQMDALAPTGKQLMRESALGAAILQYGALTEARGAEIEALKAQVDALGAAILQYGALTEARGAEIEALKTQMDALAPAATQSDPEQTAEPTKQPEAQAQETSKTTPDETKADSEVAAGRSSKAKHSASRRRVSRGKA